MYFFKLLIYFSNFSIINDISKDEKLLNLDLNIYTLFYFFIISLYLFTS